LEGEVEAIRDLCILRGCHNALDAGVATLHGCQMRSVSWMEKFGDWKHAECLAGWQGSESRAIWEFRTIEPGSLYVDVEYTCPFEDDYAEWRIRCGDTDVTFPLIDSGEREHRKAFGGALPRFRTYRVGVIEFPGPGSQQLSFGPTGEEGKGIRVSSLKLVPVQ
jgi:alpha-L-fucosidase